MEVPLGETPLICSGEGVCEDHYVALLVDGCVLVVSVAGQVDRLEGPDLVTVFVTVVGIEFGVEIGVHGDVVSAVSS